jgi:RND family efflux transporter MFP subunit
MSCSSARPILRVVLVLVLMLGAGGCKKGKDASPAGPTSARSAVRVSLIAPQATDLVRTVRTSGTLFGDEETTIAAKVPGRVVEVAADLGDEARPGALLLRIDATDYELARSERERAFRQALAQLGLEALPERGFDVDALPSVEKAHFESENAKSRYQRGEAMIKETPPMMSAQDFADLKTAWDVAQSALKVERLESQAKLAEARTLEAQVQMAAQKVVDTTLAAPGGAPANGGHDRIYEVAERMVSVGDFVQAGNPVYKLVDVDPLKLRAHVASRHLGKVKVGQRATVRVEALAKPFVARVARVSPAMEEATRTFQAELVIENPEHLLKPGAFAVAEIEVAVEPGLTIPEGSLVSFAGVDKVILVKDGLALDRAVKAGDRKNGMIEIERGLAAADRIVLDPPGSLTSGTPVEIVPAQESAPASRPGDGHAEAR